MARTTGVLNKARNTHGPSSPSVDDTNALLRVVLANGSSFTIGRPCAAAIVSICLAIILLHAGTDVALSGAILKLMRSVLP